MRKTRLLLFFSDFIVQCKLTFNSFLSSTKLSPTIVLRGPKHLWMWILWVIGGKLKQKPIYVTISCSWGYFMRLHMIYLIPNEILQGRMDAIKIENLALISLFHALSEWTRYLRTDLGLILESFQFIVLVSSHLVNNLFRSSSWVLVNLKVCVSYLTSIYISKDM